MDKVVFNLAVYVYVYICVYIYVCVRLRFESFPTFCRTCTRHGRNNENSSIPRVVPGPFLLDQAIFFAPPVLWSPLETIPKRFNTVCVQFRTGAHTPPVFSSSVLYMNDDGDRTELIENVR